MYVRPSFYLLRLVFGLFALALVSLSASAQEGASVPGVYRSSGTQQIWDGPGSTYSAASTGAVLVAGVGGITATSKFSALLADGRAAALTVARFASVSNLFGVAVSLAGIYGVDYMIHHVPAFADWMTASGVRQDPANPTQLQRSDPTVCTVAPCYSYSMAGLPGQTFSSAKAACDLWAPGAVPGGGGHGVVQPDGRCFAYKADNTFWIAQQVSATSIQPQPANWLPASMDDIAPYMTARVPAGPYLDQVAALGAKVPVTPVSVTNDPVSEPDPNVRTTNYPKPADKIGAPVQVPGNPFGLADNTPTVTKTTPGTAPLNPGDQSSVGPLPPGVKLGDAVPISTPTTTTDVSTYDPTCSCTRTVSTTAQDGAQVKDTTATTTTFTNTAGKSVVTVSTGTTTTTIDMTTGATLAPTTVVTKDQTAPASVPTDCDKRPGSVGCSDLGVPAPAEVLPSSVQSVALTPSVFTSAAACPADSVIPVHVGPFSSTATISYAKMCEATSTYVYPLVMLIGAAIAAFVFIGGLKS